MFQEFQKYTTENLHGCILNIDLLQGKNVVIILPNHCYANICFKMTYLITIFGLETGKFYFDRLFDMPSEFLRYKTYNDL